MAHLRRTDSTDIDGKTFKVKALTFEDARKAYAIIQRALPVLAVEDLDEEGGILFACLTGHLSKEDIDVLCEVFANETTVDFNDPVDGKSSRVLKLSLKDVQDEVFSGQLELMYDWLAFCVDLNFKGTLGKMGAALRKMAAKKVAQEKEKAEEAKSSHQS